MPEGQLTEGKGETRPDNIRRGAIRYCIQLAFPSLTTTLKTLK